MIDTTVDSISRYMRIDYDVAPDAPEEVTVRLETLTEARRRPAAVWKHVSETAQALMDATEWQRGITAGTVTERHAAGLRRSLFWNPFVSDSDQQHPLELLLSITERDGEPEAHRFPVDWPSGQPEPHQICR